MPQLSIGSGPHGRVSASTRSRGRQPGALSTHRAVALALLLSPRAAASATHRRDRARQQRPPTGESRRSAAASCRSRPTISAPCPSGGQVASVPRRDNSTSRRMTAGVWSGAFRRHPRPDWPRIVAEDGTIETLPFLDVVSFAPIKSRFFEKIDGSVDMGASYTQSSGVAQASFDTNAAYRQPSFEASVAFSTSLTRTSDSPDSARYALNVGFAKFHANRWVTNPLVLIEHNPVLGFDLRTTAAVAFGRFLVQSNRATVLLGAGGAVGRELPVGGTATTNVDALIGLTASLYTYDYPKTSVDLSVLVFAAERPTVRVNLIRSAQLLKFLHRADGTTHSTTAPGDRRPRELRRVLLSLGWTFWRVMLPNRIVAGIPVGYTLPRCQGRMSLKSGGNSDLSYACLRRRSRTTCRGRPRIGSGSQRSQREPGRWFYHSVLRLERRLWHRRELPGRRQLPRVSHAEGPGRVRLHQAGQQGPDARSPTRT